MNRVIKAIQKRFVNSLRDGWLWLRRGRTQHYGISYGGVSVCFSTTDRYSRRWFLGAARAGDEEVAVSRLLAETLKGDEVFFDVGAHVGEYACLAGALLPRGMVHAFEVSPHAAALLEKNVALNQLSNVSVHRTAVLERGGDTFIPRLSAPRAGLMVSPTASESLRYMRVPAVSLDGFCARRGCAPDVVKIDVEGSELSVLRGMTRLLSTRRPVIFLELHRQEKLARFGARAADVFALLHRHGYRIREVSEYRGHLPSADALREVNTPAALHENSMLFARHIAGGQTT